jgi:VCBS repeat-containing protein
MTKLASENGSNKAIAQGISAKDAGAAGARAAVDPSVKAQAVPAPVKATAPGKGVAPAMKKVLPDQADDANAVKKHHEDDQAGAVQASEGEAQQLAMVDSASAAAVGTIAADGAQDGGAAASDDSNDGGISAPLIIGGVLLVGGGAALALGGGGKKNAPPTIAGTQAVTTAEDAPITVTATATDPGDTLTYTTSAVTNGTVAAGTTAGTFVFTPTKDFNGTGTFTVTATDSKGQTATQTVTVTVTAVNDAPVITSAATASVAENAAITTEVYKVTATDVDANTTLTYSLGGADATLFNIDSKTGSVTLKASADFETDASYVFDVKASDGTATTTKSVTLTVTDVNDTPVITSGATGTVAENAATTTVVYDANATDQDAGANGTLTYTLQGADAAAFNIDSKTGEVRLNASANFEAKASYAITVKATDGGNPALSATKDVTVSVTNVNEAPTFAGATATASIAENAATSTIVFDANATDVDAADTVTYTLTGADAAAFNIDGATGEVTLKASANFEAKQSYLFNVVATDKAGLTGSQAVTLNVTNAIDPLSLDTGSFGNTKAINAAGVVGVDTLADVNYQFNETSLESDVSITNFTSNDFISFSGVDAGDYNYSASGNNLVITYLPNGGDLSTITLVNVLNNGAVVNSEATAEAALTSKLGVTTNVGGYLVGTAPPLAISVDADATDTYNAAGASVTFTDNGDLESSTVIQNFRSDDVIRLINVEDSTTVLYSNGLIDSKDLQIEYFDGNGQRSTIILDDAATGFLVSDFATASAALGGRTDFITFA